MLARLELGRTHRFGVPRTNGSGMEFPIFDRESRLVGWTRRGPELNNTLLRHPYAERLVGGTVVCFYVEIDDPADAKRAGAPPGWREPWRCLALCSAWQAFENVESSTTAMHQHNHA